MSCNLKPPSRKNKVTAEPPVAYSLRGMRLGKTPPSLFHSGKKSYNQSLSIGLYFIFYFKFKKVASFKLGDWLREHGHEKSTQRKCGASVIASIRPYISPRSVMQAQSSPIPTGIAVEATYQRTSVSVRNTSYMVELRIYELSRGYA